MMIAGQFAYARGMFCWAVVFSEGAIGALSLERLQQDLELSYFQNFESSIDVCLQSPTVLTS